MPLKEVKPFEGERLGWLAATVEAVSDFVFIADLQDRMIYANPAALKKWGYTRKEIIGKTAEFVISPNNPKDLRAAMIQTTLENPNGWEGEVINVTKDGQEFWVHLRTALVRNKKGEAIGMTGVSRDITERKKLEKANQDLQKMQEQLLRSEKLAAVGVLAAGLAHEIGNPLASISSLVQLLQRKVSDEKMLESFQSMQAHVQRISQIIQNVKDFTKEDQTQLMAVDLESVLRSALQKVCLQNSEKYVDIHTKIDSGLMRVRAEASQLSQVFYNIFTNAFEAIEKEGKLEIHAAMLVKDMAKVSIKDNGKGIYKENIRKIFEPFFTTKDVGKGAGLGLSVSYGIIKSFGGDIRVESITDQGSMFEILLPIYR